jgi:hypothetical protein
VGELGFKFADAGQREGEFRGQGRHHLGLPLGDADWFGELIVADIQPEVRSGRNAPPASGCCVSAFLEGVFDFFAGLLQIGCNFVAFALGLHPVVADGIADCSLALAVEFLGGVMDLVTQTHGASPYVAAPAT